MTEIINKFGRKIEVNSPSDFLIEYDYLSEHEIDRKWYRQGIEYLINASPVYYDEQLDDFLRHTIPDNKNRHDTVYYLLIIPEKEEKIIFSFHNFEEYLFYLQQAAYLSEKERWNTYFYPTYFLEMNKCFSLNEKSATVFKSFVIDVDNIDITPTDINDTKALQTVLRQHNLDSFPCNYCLLSGHGIHLYSMLKIDIQPNERKTLMKSLATKYKGDFAVVPSAHAFRIPTSYNIKPDEKAAKSKLFVLNKEPFDISALKSITNTVSDEMVLAYQTACNKDKNGKRLLTQRTNKLNDLITKEMKNGLSEEEKVLKTLLVELKDSGTLDVSAELFKEMKKNRGIKAYSGNQSKIEPIKMPSTEPIIIENDSPSTKKDCHNNECRKVDATQWDYVQIKQIGKKLIAVNVLNELSNYLKRHQGIHLHRRCFCLIYGNYAKLIMPMDDCLKKIRVFIPDCFWETAKSIIKDIYATSVFYHYSYQKIAELLEFDENDYQQAFSPLFRGDKRQAKKDSDKKYYKRTKSKMAKERKLIVCRIIVENPQITFNEMHGIFADLSRSSFFEYKKELKDSHLI